MTGALQFVKMMTLSWPRHTLQHGQIWLPLCVNVDICYKVIFGKLTVNEQNDRRYFMKSV